MLCRIYHTSRIFLDPWEDWLLAPIVYPWGLDDYTDENMYRVVGIWSEGQGVVLACYMLTRVYPGWQVRVYHFNSATGFAPNEARVGTVSHEPPTSDALTHDDWFHHITRVTQDVYGGLWVTYATGEIAEIGGAGSYDPDDLGLVSIPAATIVDRPRAYLVMGGTFAPEQQALCVYSIGLSGFLPPIPLPENVMAIAADSGTIVHVLLVDGSIVTLDYITREFYGHRRVPFEFPAADSAHPAVHFAYSRALRRFMMCKFQDELEIVTMESTYFEDRRTGYEPTIIEGYRDAPVAVATVGPIPLRPLRAGRSVAFWVRQVGDLGEPIVGAVDVAADDAGVTVAPPKVSIDGDGDGVFQVTGVTAGTSGITVTAEVACTLTEVDEPNRFLFDFNGFDYGPGGGPP